MHIIQSKICQERSKIMNFCKRSYQSILRYMYTETIKRGGEISLHKHFKFEAFEIFKTAKLIQRVAANLHFKYLFFYTFCKIFKNSLLVSVAWICISEVLYDHETRRIFVLRLHLPFSADRAVARTLIGGCIFIYSGYARLTSFEINFISKETSRVEPEYMNIHPPPPPN